MTPQGMKQTASPRDKTCITIVLHTRVLNFEVNYIVSGVSCHIPKCFDFEHEGLKPLDFGSAYPSTVVLVAEMRPLDSFRAPKASLAPASATTSWGQSHLSTERCTVVGRHGFRLDETRAGGN